MVSIIIPVYNVSEFIAQCIESCIYQTYKDIEIIVVNDGSTDDSGIIVDKYAQIDSRIKVYNQRNQGVVVARELGISKSSGEYLCFIDGDDFIEHDMISRLLDAGKNCDIVTCGFYVYDDISKYKVVRNNYYIGEEKNDIINSLLLRTCTWSLCAKLFRRGLFSGVTMPYGVKMGEDGIVCFQLHNNASKVTYINSPLYYYRQRHTSVTHNHNGNYAYAMSIINFIKCVMDMCNKYLRIVDERSKNTFLMSQIFVYYVNGGDLSLLKENIKFNVSLKDIFSSYLSLSEKFGVTLYIKANSLSRVIRKIYTSIS